MAALDPDETGDPAGAEVPLDVGGRHRQREGLRVAAAEPLHQVDLLQGVHRRVRPLAVDRADGDVRRPELPADAAGAQARDVGHQFRLAHREIHRIEAAALADRVRDVVVAVDERNGAQQRLGPRTVVDLGGKAGGREGGNQDARTHRHDHVTHLRSEFSSRPKAAIAPPPAQDYVSFDAPSERHDQFRAER